MTRPSSLPRKTWQIAPAMPDEIKAQGIELSPIVKQILFNRGFECVEDMQMFLSGRYPHSTDPFLLAGMAEAMARIAKAITCEETIAVYGDFDADGVTSTVLLLEALRGLGLSSEQVIPYIPDRIDEGYGLNNGAFDKLKEMGVRLVITVDCGIRAVEEVAYANSIGLDVIVTDHHDLATGHLPPATAVINPKRPDSCYPEKMLAGVGIAYKLAQALHIAMPGNSNGFDLTSLLDLVALGTVADLAPLQGENRLLVTSGIKIANRGQRLGLKTLCVESGINYRGGINAETIGFGLGPRINAAGRLTHAYRAAELLYTSDEKTATACAVELSALNQRRQTLTKQFSDEALCQIDSEAPVTVVASEDFLPGLVGLVASRIVEQTYRPAIVLNQGEGVSHGSCRSIPEVHITNALNRCADLLVRYGGHSQAAGITIKNENIPEFKMRLAEIVRSEISQYGQLLPSLPVDAEIPLNAIVWPLQKTLQQLEPTGQGNSNPIFLSKGVTLQNYRVVGSDKTHLQITIEHKGAVIKGIAFKQASWAEIWGEMGDVRLDVVYQIGVNEFRGNRSLQLNILDMQIAEQGQQP